MNNVLEFKRVCTLSIPAALTLTVASAAAQQTCNSRKEDGASTSSTYILSMKQKAVQRKVVLHCTEKEDVVKVTLLDMTSGRTLQTFHERQMQTYLEASTPDLDTDGYADLVLVTSWGNPNATFKAWRYDPAKDRISTVIAGSGTEFVRTRSGDITAYAKGGADAWGYTVFKWKNQRLVPAYAIEEQIGPTSECAYYDTSVPSRTKRVRDRRVLDRLKNYCGIGGAGLLEQGQNLLQN